MTMRSNRFVTRLQPGIVRGRKPDPKRERSQRDAADRDFQREIGELEDAIPGDKNVYVEFRSKGPNREISVARPKKALEPRFDVFEVMRQNGRGSLWIPKQSLQIGDRLIFATDATAGTSFLVRVYALRPGRGAKATQAEAPTLPPVLDEPGPSQEAIAATVQPKKNKKSGKN